MQINLIINALSILLLIPSVALYSIQINVIRAYNNFHSHFYLLFILRGIIVICYELAIFYGGKLPRFGLFLGFYRLLPNFALKFHFFVLYPFFVDNMLTAFMLLNRLTGIAFPMHQKKIWQWAFPMVVAFSFLFPLPFSTFLLSMNTFLRIDNTSEGTVFAIAYQVPDGQEDPLVSMNKAGAIFGVPFVAFCFLLNFCCIYVLRVYRKKISQNSGIMLTELKLEMKITVSAIVTLICHGAVIIINLIAMILINSGYYQFGLSLSHCNEIVYIFSVLTVPSLLLLWASSKMRRKCQNSMKWLIPRRLLLFQCNNNKVTINNVIVTNNNNNKNITPVNVIVGSSRIGSQLPDAKFTNRNEGSINVA